MRPTMPQKPRRGQRISDVVNASWLGKLHECVAWCMAGYRGDRKTIVVNNITKTISALRRGGGLGGSSESVGAYPCKITGAPTGGVYPVDIYDTRDGDKVGSGHAMPLTLRVSETVPVDEWIMAPSNQIEYLPGDDGS